jgi:two-component system chemotaxis response regulator CheB
MYKAVIIGGSAGSFNVITSILNALPDSFGLTIFLCLHRLKHVRSGFVEVLSIKSNINILEPYDKEPIKGQKAYLAPANYHMFVEIGNTIALSTEDVVNHSRPSIDLSFITAAKAYRNKLIGIILSGANKDGALGLKKVKDYGGTTIVQDPNECEIRTMPDAAIKSTNTELIYKTKDIINFLNNYNRNAHKN